MAINADLARASLLNLTTKDAAVLESSLASLLRLIPPATNADRDLTPLHDEAIVPRVAHVLSSLASNGFRLTPSIVALACQVLLAVMRDDDIWQQYLAREVGSKCVLSLLKQVHPHQSFATHAFELMTLFVKFEKGIALFARLDGAIEFIISTLVASGVEDRQLCYHGLNLLVLYCKPNGNNVALLVRKLGIPLFNKLLLRYSLDIPIASLCVDGLTLCAKQSDAARRLIDDMDVCPSLISMLSAMVKEHVTAKTKTPLHDSPIVTSVVNLLAAQAASNDSVTSMWFSGGFVVLWALIRDRTVPQPLFRAASSILWRMMTVSSGSDVSMTTTSATACTMSLGPGGLDLNAVRLWKPLRKPRKQLLPSVTVPQQLMTPVIAGESTLVSKLLSTPVPTSTRYSKLRPFSSESNAVVPSVGSVGDLTNTTGSLLDDGDAVLLPRPASVAADMHIKPMLLDYSSGPVGPAGVGFRGMMKDRFRKSGGVMFSDEIVTSTGQALPLSLKTNIPPKPVANRPQESSPLANERKMEKSSPPQRQPPSPIIVGVGSSKSSPDKYKTNTSPRTMQPIETNNGDDTEIAMSSVLDECDDGMGLECGSSVVDEVVDETEMDSLSMEEGDGGAMVDGSQVDDNDDEEEDDGEQDEDDRDDNEGEDDDDGEGDEEGKDGDEDGDDGDGDVAMKAQNDVTSSQSRQNTKNSPAVGNLSSFGIVGKALPKESMLDAEVNGKGKASGGIGIAYSRRLKSFRDPVVSTSPTGDNSGNYTSRPDSSGSVSLLNISSEPNWTPPTDLVPKAPPPQSQQHRPVRTSVVDPDAVASASTTPSQTHVPVDKSIMRNRKVHLSYLDWKENPHWFPELQLGVSVQQNSYATLLTTAPPPTDPTTTANQFPSSESGDVRSSTPAGDGNGMGVVDSITIPKLTSASGFGPPPKPGQSNKSPRARVSVRLSSSSSTSPPPSSFEFPFIVPPSVNIITTTDTSPKSELYKQRAECIASVKPTETMLNLMTSSSPRCVPPGSTVSPSGVVSTRQFVVSNDCVPSVRHSLPPPIPEPFAPVLPLPDREVLVDELTRVALRRTAAQYIDDAEEVMQYGNGIVTPPLVPPEPDVGHVVYDVYGGSSVPIGGKPVAPLPLPTVVQSTVLDAYFDAKSTVTTTVTVIPKLASVTACTCSSRSTIPPLQFESRFESGNLRAAVRVGPTEYELMLEPDTNTLGHTQWFYFRVTGMVEGVRYSFHVMNLEKPASLFNQGMRPLVYIHTTPSSSSNFTSRSPSPIPLSSRSVTMMPTTSSRTATPRNCPSCSSGGSNSGVGNGDGGMVPGDGWRRCGDAVCYYANRYRKLPNEPALHHTVEDVGSGHGIGSGSDGSASEGDGGVVVMEDGSGDDDGGGGQGGDAKQPKPKLTSNIKATGLSRSVNGSVLMATPAVPNHDSVATLFGGSESNAGSEFNTQQLYSESWSMVFPAGTVTAFFAYCHPYTFTDLMMDIARWDHRCVSIDGGNVVPIQDAVVPKECAVLSIPSNLPKGCGGSSLVPITVGAVTTTNIMVRSVLCRSIGGNVCPLLTITDFTASNEIISSLPYIVLSARVHPGETNASWMMRGVIDFLTSTDPDAVTLRSKAVFKIVPFLNPDGVVNGHHRTGLYGVDLNRHWSTPAPDVCPTVYSLKHLMSTLVGHGKNVAMFCDFHGHSRRKNVFMFGCENEVGVPERVFPKLLGTRNPDFCYRNCSFKISKSKVNCARVAVWRDLGIVNSFTIESSFAGADERDHANTHFSPSHYEALGHDFCRSLLDLLNWGDEVQAAVSELRELHVNKFSPKSKRGGQSRGRSTSRPRNGQRSGSVGPSQAQSQPQRKRSMSKPHASKGKPASGSSGGDGGGKKPKQQKKRSGGGGGKSSAAKKGSGKASSHRKH